MIVCGKCKSAMRTGSSKHSIRKTRSAYAKTVVCPTCFYSAQDWQKRDITSEDYALESVKKELRKHVKGRVMVRQDRSYKGDEQRGIFTWAAYFDDSNDRDVISKVIAFGGFNPSVFRIIGGSYGYVMSFRNILPEKFVASPPTTEEVSDYIGKGKDK